MTNGEKRKITNFPGGRDSLRLRILSDLLSLKESRVEEGETSGGMARGLKISNIVLKRPVKKDARDRRKPKVCWSYDL